MRTWHREEHSGFESVTPGIVTVISPHGCVCRSAATVDASVSPPHLCAPPPTPLIRKASRVWLNCPPTPTAPFQMKSPDVGDPFAVCVIFLASFLFRSGRKRLIREKGHDDVRKHLLKPLSQRDMCSEGDAGIGCKPSMRFGLGGWPVTDFPVLTGKGHPTTPQAEPKLLDVWSALRAGKLPLSLLLEQF